jgi:uncharacterized protein
MSISTKQDDVAVEPVLGVDHYPRESRSEPTSEGDQTMYVDVFSHILPPKYLAEYRKRVPAINDEYEVKIPPVVDLDIRFRLMNRYPNVLQMLTVARVPLERYATPEDAVELARIANDELAELVINYPDRFFGAAACLPMNNIDAALDEADRAITKLGLKGVQIYSRIGNETLDAAKFRPLYKKMAQHNLPIWIHPTFVGVEDPYYGVFGWPFETASAMLCLVRSGVFVDYPDIKFIVHHAGSMVPFFAERIRWTMSLFPQTYPDIHEHFKKFYGDTAIYGHTPALMCAYDYFGADHLLFGTDAPLGPKWGMVEDTIESIKRMAIPEEEKEKILKKNAVDLFKLAL